MFYNMSKATQKSNRVKCEWVVTDVFAYIFAGLHNPFCRDYAPSL